MSYTVSIPADFAVRLKQADGEGLNTPTGFTGHQWIRTLRRTQDTGGPLAYAGNQRIYFDT